MPSSKRPTFQKAQRASHSRSLYANEDDSDDDYEKFEEAFVPPGTSGIPQSQTVPSNISGIIKQKSLPEQRTMMVGRPSSAGKHVPALLVDVPTNHPPPIPSRLRTNVAPSGPAFSPPTNAPPPLPSPRKGASPKPPPPLPPFNRPPASLPVSSSTPPTCHAVLPPSSAPPVFCSEGETYEDFDFGRTSEKMEACPGDGMSLLKFFKDFKDEFPKSFEVTLGFSCQGDETSISEGERFVAHFLKRTKIITIRDENNETYSIPFNSALEFGLLHNPHNNQKEAQNGFIFKSAGDLMISRVLPKAIRARKAFRGISPESSVEHNELLLIKEVVQKEGERRYVKCIQLSTGKEKHLHEDCCGQFSTNPYDVRLMLPDILKHFQLPLKAVLYIGSDIDEDLPMSLVTSVIEIVTHRTDETLVASTIMDENPASTPAYMNMMDDEAPANQLNEIPLAFDINVNPMHVTPLTEEKLLEETKRFFEDFNPLNVYPYLMNSSLTQLSLMKVIRKDTPNVGVELIPSKNILQMLEKEKLQSASSSADNAETALLSTKVLLLESKHQELQEMLGQGASSQTFNKMSGTVKQLQEENSQLRREFQVLRKEVSELRSLVSGQKRSMVCLTGYLYINNDTF